VRRRSLGIVVLGLAVTLLCVTVLSTENAVRSASYLAVSEEPVRPSALFIGDSFTEGTGAGSRNLGYRA